MQKTERIYPKFEAGYYQLQKSNTIINEEFKAFYFTNLCPDFSTYWSN